MQSSSEQPLVGGEHSVTTLITSAKETKGDPEEFQRQSSSHSETEPIRRVSSSTRKKKRGKKRVKWNVLYYYALSLLKCVFTL